MSPSSPATMSELERLEPFSRIGAHGKALLAHAVIRKQLPRAANVLYRGQPIAGAYLVVSGRLRVFSVLPNGTEATLYFIDPGETCVLALNSLFNDLPYPAWVQTEVATTVAIVPGPVYRRLFESEPVIQNLTVQALSTLVYRLMAELEQVHGSSHRQRLAQFLQLHATDGTLRITQQRLAQHLGTTREVVARILRGFVSQGLVVTGRGSVAIRDQAGLAGVAAKS